MSELSSSGEPQNRASTTFNGSWLSRCSHAMAGQKAGIKALSWAVVVNFILFAIFLTYTTPAYETDDDLEMQFIASGFYTGHPDAHLVFTNILIGWVLKFLYGSWAGCNWYLIYLVAVHYAALTAIAFLVISRRGGWLFTLLYIGFFCIVEMHILLDLEFTTTAFLAGMAGILLLVDGLLPGQRVNWSKVIIGICFLSLMCLIREEVALLCGAIGAPFIFERLGLNGWRRLLGTGLACIGIFVSLQGVNHWAYQRDSAWAEFSEYNNMRGEITDTPLKQFLPKAAPVVGWTQNDVWMFSKYYFPDPDLFAGVSKMGRVLDEIKILQRQAPRPSGPSLAGSPALVGSGSLPNIANIDLANFGNLRDSTRLMNLAVLNAIWCIIVARTLRRRVVTVLLICFATFCLLDFYLLATAFLPERVAYTFPLFIHAICLYWATGFQNLTPPIRTNRFHYYAATFWWPGVLRLTAFGFLLVWAILYVFNLSMLADSLRSANTYNQNRKFISQKLVTPFRTLLPAGKKPILIELPDDLIFEEALFFYSSAEKEVPFFEVPWGSTTHSPIFNQVLDQHHLNPYSLSVVSRPDVFFLMQPKYIAPFKTFYREHYGLDIRFDVALKMPQFEEFNIYLYQAHIDGGKP
jgi:hypothetical protein